MIIDGKKVYTAKYKGKYYNLYAVSEDGSVYNVVKHRVITPYITPNGYYQIMLYDNGKSYPASIHRLVYESITGVNPTDEHKEIDHLDGDRSNNSLSNLELVTHAENIHRAIKKELINYIEIIYLQKRLQLFVKCCKMGKLLQKLLERLGTVQHGLEVYLIVNIVWTYLKIIHGIQSQN